MAKTHWLNKDDLFPTVKNKLERVDVLLDVGCGIKPQIMVVPRVHICVEPFQQYIDHLRDKISEIGNDRSYYVFLQADWETACKILPPKSVDTVILGDVIEHINKRDGLRLLRATEKIARKQIAIFTPLGFVPQHHNGGKDAWGLDGGEWQRHKSGWMPEEFDNSWEIYAVKEYHLADNMGKKLKKPWGALWAVKTFPVETKHSESKKRRLVLEDTAYAADSILILKMSTIFIDMLVKLKKAILPVLRPFLPK